MESSESRKVHKSRTDRLVDGVCAGIAEYFGWDATLVRLLWLSSVFFGGVGIAAYVAAMILLPSEPVTEASMAKAQKKRIDQGLFIGVTLILIGIIFLLDELHILSRHWFWFHLPWDFVVPALFVLAGLGLIFWPGRSSKPSHAGQIDGVGGMRRKTTDKKIFGVCAGLADHIGIDPSIVRILWVVATFIIFPLGLFLYVLVAALIPDENGKRLFDSKPANHPS